ncbi:MAG: hypothetical protein ABIJ34_01500 [archaeon]
MVNLTLEIRSKKPADDFQYFATMLELTQIEDESEDGFLDLTAHNEITQVTCFAKEPMKIEFKEMHFSDIKGILEVAIPVTKDRRLVVDKLSIDVPSDLFSTNDTLDHLDILMTSIMEGRELDTFQFKEEVFFYLKQQLTPFATYPDLGVLRYTFNQIPHQTVEFVRVPRSKDITNFFKQSRNLRQKPLREILRESYAAHITDFEQDDKAVDRALAYMASQAMGPITECEGIESLGWYHNPSNKLSYNLTTCARAVVCLVEEGINTPKAMNTFISQFDQQSIGTHTYIWDDDARKLHDLVLDEGFDVADMPGIAPSAKVDPIKGETVHYTRVHYPFHRNSPTTETKVLDRMVDLGILRVNPFNGVYSANEVVM